MTWGPFVAKRRSAPRQFRRHGGKIPDQTEAERLAEARAKLKAGLLIIGHSEQVAEEMIRDAEAGFVHEVMTAGPSTPGFYGPGWLGGGRE